MAKITNKDLYSLFKREIGKLIDFNTKSPYGTQTARINVVSDTLTNGDVSTAALITAVQTMLAEALPNQIISGLEVVATDPPSGDVVVLAGRGSAGGRLYELTENVTVNVPLNTLSEVYYLSLYGNRVLIENTFSFDRLLLAKIIIPNAGVTQIIRNDDTGSWDGYILMRKELKFYGNYRGKLEEDSLEFFRDNIGDILADNLIGNIKLSENLTITNTSGSIELDSSEMRILDTLENTLAKFNRRGVFFYDVNGKELSRFTDTDAKIGNIIIENTNLHSNNYVSGLLGSGFSIQDSGYAEFQDVLVRGIISSSVFKYDTVSAIGGSFLVVNSDTLAESMSALDSSILTLSGNIILAVGDLLRIKEGNSEEWLEVTNTSNAPVYTVTRDKAGSYSANVNPQWKSGTAVINYGQSGDGFVYMTASETNAPYLSIVTHAGTPWSSVTTHLRLGNLNGFLGYSTDLYGIAIGTTDDYLKYDPTNGLRIKGEIIITGGNASVTYSQEVEPGSSTDPNTPKNGDIWYVPSTGALYVYVTDTWVAYTSSGITDAGGKIIVPPTPVGAGLYLGSTYMGYYDGDSWNAFIKNDGTFQFTGDGSNYIAWNGVALTVRGALNAGDITTGTLTGISITGNTIRTAASGSRIVMDSSAFIAYDDDSIGNEIFKVLLSGVNVGDVIIGNAASTNYVKYDASAGTLTVRGVLNGADITASSITADSYGELRSIYPYTKSDSLDSTHPLELKFKIASETTSIVSVKVSFALSPFRSYSTTIPSGGGSTTVSGGSSTSGTTGVGSHSHKFNIQYISGAINANMYYGSNQMRCNGHSGTIYFGDHTISIANSSSGNQIFINDGGVGLCCSGGGTIYTGYSTHDSLPSHRHAISLANNTTSYECLYDGGSSGRSLYTGFEVGGLLETSVYVQDHSHTTPDHTHDTPSHTHSLTFGIYEETNSPTINVYVDNGSGYGAAIGTYTTDQLDIDITASISGTGWKKVKFTTNALCRIDAIVECKLDITA